MPAFHIGRASTGARPGPGDPDYIDPAVWVVAFTVVVGAMAVIFDGTIVSVALHDLTRQLHVSLGAIQWVTTGYLLALFVTIPIAGWAQAARGGKRLAPRSPPRPPAGHARRAEGCRMAAG